MIRDYAAWAAFLEARRDMPFDWGSNDCVLFAAGALEALTGRDALSGIGRWTTERGALRALARRGGLIAAVDGVLRPIALAHAHRGDIGAVAGERGPLLVVIEGMTLAGPGPDGISRTVRADLTHAWSAEP